MDEPRPNPAKNVDAAQAPRDPNQVNAYSRVDSGSTPASAMPTVIGPGNAGGTSELVPPTIEGYEVGRCLGRGGMGAVYEGVQHATGRRVAIKLMLDAGLSSESGRKRFEREVEVVARLEHPGIIGVLDSGVRKGRYYYVMEYVEGRALDEALAPGMCDVREALALMVEVCDAVDYAHQRAVLHRDLKPGNVLVDMRGRARLLDFGIAQLIDGKAASRETVSRPGQLVGTVAYMAPEQASGSMADMGVRTDVYALGAIAYELLTGKLPCPVEGPLVSVLRGIAEVDPVRPSLVRPALSRDIDAVLLKALEKQPAKRYVTAGELAEDFRRVLAGEPVAARPVGVSGRAWRWANRNRTLSIVGAASLVMLVVVSTGLILRIVQERDRAVANFTQLKKVLESADPESGEGGGTIPQLMDSAAKGLTESPPESPESEADVREIIGGVYRKFGVYDKAADNQRRVLEVRRAGARGDDPLLAEALHNLAATLWWDGKYTEAEPLYREALEMRQRLYATKDNASVAFSKTHLAACRLKLGRVESARSLYQDALAMRKRLYGDEHEQVAQSLNNLAKCDMETEQFAEAEESFRAALAMITKLRGDSYMGTAAASGNLADCLMRRAEADRVQGQEDAALQRAGEALKLYERAYAIRAAMFTTGHHLSAGSLNGQARALLFLGRLAEAEAVGARAMEMVLKKRGPDHPDVTEMLATSAEVALARGDLLVAKSQYERAITIASAIRPPADLRRAELRDCLSVVLARMGDADGARRMHRESLAVIEAHRGNNSVAVRASVWRASR
ncbi:MAG TPA: serine/threonine-protein kinase [Phycisphaerales bacterium]|nr:serine/threonine-protein kinase [Phycisphaerales bacterium]